MNRVSIDLANCYGIKSLQYNFNFTDKNFCAIYAQNGVMKSSLAQTFYDLANGVPSADRIFPTKTTKRSIKDENGAELVKESVLALRPYDEEFGPTEKTCNLLVNSKLRKEYEQLQIGIEEAEQRLLKAILLQAHSRRDFQTE
ncbi:MAG: phage infection protein, partial [Acidobacteriia bacterium]|nr:phage infection protein [Terriglobia bacterium]